MRELTGLRFDPYFTGTKLTWLAENDPSAWAGVTTAPSSSAPSTATWWPASPAARDT